MIGKLSSFFDVSKRLHFAFSLEWKFALVYNKSLALQYCKYIISFQHLFLLRRNQLSIWLLFTLALFFHSVDFWGGLLLCVFNSCLGVDSTLKHSKCRLALMTHVFLWRCLSSFQWLFLCYDFYFLLKSLPNVCWIILTYPLCLLNTLLLLHIFFPLFWIWIHPSVPFPIQFMSLQIHPV